jgi:hypothetical protein
MSGDRVAWEGRPIDEQYVIPLAGKQHRSRRSGNARAHHNGVEDLHHVSSISMRKSHLQDGHAGPREVTENSPNYVLVSCRSA